MKLSGGSTFLPVAPRSDAAAEALRLHKFFVQCELPHIPTRQLVISPRTIEQYYDIGEFAVISRKPTFLRWLEEAEAKQVCEWAGLEQACDRPDIDTEQLRGSGERASLLHRLRGLLGNQTVQIARDDQ